MAFVLIWDCCILCDSVCSGPADYVNLMGEGRRYHNCLSPPMRWAVTLLWASVCAWLADWRNMCCDVSSSPGEGGWLMAIVLVLIYPHPLITVWFWILGANFFSPNQWVANEFYYVSCILELVWQVWLNLLFNIISQFRPDQIKGKKHYIKHLYLSWLLHVQERRESQIAL